MRLFQLATGLLLSLAPPFVILSDVAEGHGTMIIPEPRQPESVYWYQVGCLIGCRCTGSGKEEYPTIQSLDCPNPIEPTHTDPSSLTWNTNGASPRGEWNEYMPWRAPGSSLPLDSCGIASGFLPSADVQYPHTFSQGNGDDGGTIIKQGAKGTELPVGAVVTTWRVGDIVEASFYLNVNHGGGYQYRVCPRRDGVVVDEACFERNPLVFATETHTVVLGDDRRISIPATDVTTGTRPDGSAWRRIPIPACDCDAGTGCRMADGTTRDSEVTYGDGKAYGSCTTGLQFDAEHIVDGSWPEGYGFYVARIGAGKGGDGMTSPCQAYSNATVCQEDSRNSCRWYGEKNVCYETRGEDTDNSATDDKFCHLHSGEDEALCTQAMTASGEPCTWYESATKFVCYDKLATKSKGTRSLGFVEMPKEDGKTGKWHITDQLYAPATPGDYILQWRWDNEQTPQIWTTCADISVVQDEDISGAVINGVLPYFLLLGLIVFILIMALLSKLVFAPPMPNDGDVRELPSIITKDI